MVSGEWLSGEIHSLNPQSSLILLLHLHVLSATNRDYEPHHAGASARSSARLKEKNEARPG